MLRIYGFGPQRPWGVYASWLFGVGGAYRVLGPLSPSLQLYSEAFWDLCAVHAASHSNDRKFIKKNNFFRSERDSRFRVSEQLRGKPFALCLLWRQMRSFLVFLVFYSLFALEANNNGVTGV